MKGASLFVQKNFKSTNTTFELCMQVIVYAYFELSKNKNYSRSEILKQTTRVRGRLSTVVELEDYLRNDLVTNFIKPHLSKFGLEHYLFIPGAEEISENIKVGILDIKVCSPSFTGAVYYIFECKRLNKSIIKNYLKEGVERFVSRQYYPNSDTPVAGMISFLESTEVKSRIDIDKCFDELNTELTNQSEQVNLVVKLAHHPISSNDYVFLNNYKFIFYSIHKRTKSKDNITLYHIFLDYNDIILQ